MRIYNTCYRENAYHGEAPTGGVGETLVAAAPKRGKSTTPLGDKQQESKEENAHVE